MKICFISDTHFGGRGDNDKIADFQEKFYTEHFFPYLEKNKITTIVHAGDMFDKRKGIDYMSLHRCKQFFFEKLVAQNIKLVVNVGNHDSFYKNTLRINSPRLLLGEYANRIAVIDEPIDVELGGTTFAFFPWICQDNYEDSIYAVQRSKASVAIAHLELNGFEMYKGSIPHHDGMSASVFDKFDDVYTGHFHTRSSKGNIHYLGCPYEMCWSDYNDPKGFHVFDTDTGKATFVQNPFSLFHKITYSDKEMSKKDIKDIDVLQYEGCFVKVLVEDKTQPKLFEEFWKKLGEADPAAVEAIEGKLDLDNVDADELLEGIVDDNATMLRRAVDMSETDVDKTELATLLIELYHEAEVMD